MKKLLAVLLVVMLVMGGSTLAWAAGETDTMTATSKIQLLESGATPTLYVGIQAGDMTSSGWTLTLPLTAGSSNQFLQTNGSGITTWATALTSEADTLQTVTTRGATTDVSSLFQNVLGIELGKDDATNVAGAMKLWAAGANNYYTTITAAENTANLAITLPAAPPAATYLLNMTSAGVIGYDSSSYLTSEVQTLQDVCTLGATTTTTITITNAAGLIVGEQDTANVPGVITLWAAGDNTAYTTTIQTGTQAGAITYTLPTDDGDNGEMLTTNGSGVLSWTAPSSSVKWNAITNPDGALSLTMAGNTSTWTSSTADWGGFILANSAANPSAGASLLNLQYTANGDADGVFIKCQDDMGGTPTTVFSVGADGAVTAGNVNLSATTNYILFGPDNTIGTWKMVINGNHLEFQRYDADSYVTKFTMQD